MTKPNLRTHLLALIVLATLAASLQLAPPASASLGRVVALGDSLASGMGLGSSLPMFNPACGRTSGSYPALTAAKLSPSTFVDVTCNGGHSGVYEFSWTGLPQAPGNNGKTIPPQYDALDASTAAVILGTGGNEAYFGEVVKACTGADANVNAFFQGGNYTNSCAAYNNSNAGHNLIATRVANSKTLVAGVLTKIHQRSPNAKIFLVGVPRVARPSGVGCMFNGMFMTEGDGPVFATWEDGLRSAMISDVAAFNSAVPGNYVRYVDAQTISGTSHTMCETNWSERWMNNWVPPTGNVPNWGLELHNTPIGAEMTSRAIVDSFYAAGLNTGSQTTNPTKPVVTINAPANNSATKNSSTTLNFTATDNVAIASCTRTSPSSVPLNPGQNTITVTCLDHAGNSGEASVVVTRDNTPPSIAIDSPASGTNTTASSVVLNYSASDDLGSPTCSPASGSSRPLVIGANTLSVSCSDGAGNSATASVVVNRGKLPVVLISAPANGSSATTQSVNLAYTVDGVASIPSNTSCTVAGNASSNASANAVTLAPGSNTITVLCANQFGPGAAASVTIVGSPPSDVSITAPAGDTITTAGSINVAYEVSGASAIPSGTTCKVNDLNSTSTTTNPVALTLGSNAVTVVCTGAFGSKSSSINVTRGNPPAVSITSPSSGLETAASSINVAYTVDGVPAIPAGTTCAIGEMTSTSASSNNVALVVGSNAIAVTCTNQFGVGTAASVHVTRGAAPIVAIDAPADGANTTASSINVAYTVGGANSIPGGTTCTVGGASSNSTTANAVALNLGANSIAVACTNGFGTGNSPTITVNRGVVPLVTITAPANGVNTAASSINVAYSVNGGSAIPAGTTCTVRGVASTNTTANSALLSIGSNVIAVACTNAFGTSTAATRTVNRGALPAILISSPSDGANTTASSINLAYTVDGVAAIPNGTSCTVGGSASASATSNSVALNLGANNFAVVCQNIYGTGPQASVTINRGMPPVVGIVAPADGTETTANFVNVAYTVNSGGAIPSGTACTVGGVSSTSTTTNPVDSSSLGAHTITVTCTSVFGSDSQSVTVTRGNGPTVAITAPASGLTSGSSTNVVFTVNGGNSIPGGVTCSVGNEQTSSTNANSVELTLDQVNVITVACSNGLGTDTKSVTLERLAPAAVTITSPTGDLQTDRATATVTFTASGSGPISCVVNGEASDGSTIVTLSDGDNLVTVTCTNRLGSDTRTVTIDYGPAPRVLIFAALHTDTPAQRVNATFAVDGNVDSVPGGYSCTINDVATSTPRLNDVELVPGQNTVKVRCANSYGTGSAMVFVNYIPPIVPPDEPVQPPPLEPATVTTLHAKLGGKSKLVPARRGGMFLKRGVRGGLAIKVKLDAAAKVAIKLERQTRAKSKRFKSVGSDAASLPAGSSTLRLSGRVAGRALSGGFYRLRISIPGTKLTATTKTFKVTR